LSDIESLMSEVLVPQMTLLTSHTGRFFNKRLTSAHANLPPVGRELRGKDGSGCPVTDGVDELVGAIFERGSVEFDREDETTGLNGFLDARHLGQHLWRGEIDVAEQQGGFLRQGGEVEAASGGAPVVESHPLGDGELEDALIHLASIDAEDIHAALQQRKGGTTRCTTEVESGLAAQIELIPATPREGLFELQPSA